MDAKKIIEELCAAVDVKINGDRAWDIQVRNPDFYTRVLAEGSRGVGESYMLGWWDCDDLFMLAQRLLSSRENRDLRSVGWRTRLEVMRARLQNIQTTRQSRALADTHYNLSNALFENMLGPSMAYSCAYWTNADTLDAAQTAKFDLICRKLDLKPGERLLDIGCGWGSLARHAAREHGVEVVGLTVAREQAEYARSFCDGLPVAINYCDYREFDYRDHGGLFDKVASVGMVEHVGPANYRTLFETATHALRDEGLFLLHTIGSDISVTVGDPWISKYIFPGGVLPSVQQLSAAAEGLMVLQDAHNIGVHYTPTLRAWHDRFETWWHSEESACHRPQIWGDEATFRRMWRYYLLGCAADFSVGDSQVWQFVFATGHLPDGYNCAR